MDAASDPPEEGNRQFVIRLESQEAMKFAICQEMFVDWDWKRQCQFISEVGYTGIELAPFTLAPRITDVPLEQRKMLRNTAQEHGLEIMGLHWLLAKTQGLHLTSNDEQVRRATSDYVIELGRACADFGGDVLVFGSPLQRNLTEGTSRAVGLERAAEVFRRTMPVLAERGVKICMEPLTPAETNFITSCADAVELIELVAHPNFVLHQDVKAMLSETESIPALIHKYAHLTGHFHVNDSNLLGPGMGSTDYEPIFRALLETKYSGWVSVEVFDYKPGAEKIARDSFEYMQRILAKIG